MVVAQGSHPSIHGFLGEFGPFVHKDPVSVVAEFNYVAIVVSCTSYPFPTVPTGSWFKSAHFGPFFDSSGAFSSLSAVTAHV